MEENKNLKEAYLNENVYDNLPHLLKTLVSQFTKREKDIILISSLGVLSNCLPNIIGVYNRKKCSPHLYTMVVAPPASGKGSMNFCSNLIEKIHNKTLSVSQSEIKDWQKKKEGQKPKLNVKILPGNVSSSKFYSHMSNSKHGLLMFESEADSISNMIKQDWGNFSDILRKAFHHEKISISRESDDKFIEIKSPKLSMVISGTPGQVKPLIQSVENGLFSRFLYYYFDDGVKWKSVSPTEDFIDLTDVFSNAGGNIYKLYEELTSLEEEIEFKLTKEQWEKLDKTLEFATNIFIANGLTSLISSVFRIGLILFKIAMILTSIRNIETLHTQKTLTCNDLDFDSAHSMIKTLLDHTIDVSELFIKERYGLSVHEYSILSALPNKFKRAEAIVISGKLSIKNRTMDNYLKRWCEKRVIKKSTYGVYEKIKKKRTL